MTTAPPPLPPMQQVTLSEAEVAQLFFDIEHAGEWLGATAKGPQRGAPGPSLASPAAAYAALRAGAAGVQLRYRFAGEEWWDTLMPVAAGVRLVRISHSAALRTTPATEPG